MMALLVAYFNMQYLVMRINWCVHMSTNCAVFVVSRICEMA